MLFRFLPKRRLPALFAVFTVVTVLTAPLLGGCNGGRLQEAGAGVNGEADPFADEESFELPPANDPLESFNRAMFAFNTKLDKYLIKPVTKGYGKITPRPLRAGIRNFLNNLKQPVWALNSLLQGKFRFATIGALRFFLNTTVGLGGIFDPATHAFELPAHREDFGQTLGHWGMRPGPYLVLPVFGPRNLRDAAGDLPTVLHDPNRYVFEDSETRLLLRAIDALERRSSLMHLDPLLEQSDSYLFVRESYRQAREHQVRDRAAPRPRP